MLLETGEPVVKSNVSFSQRETVVKGTVSFYPLSGEPVVKSTVSFSQWRACGNGYSVLSSQWRACGKEYCVLLPVESLW